MEVTLVSRDRSVFLCCHCFHLLCTLCVFHATTNKVFLVQVCAKAGESSRAPPRRPSPGSQPTGVVLVALSFSIQVPCCRCCSSCSNSGSGGSRRQRCFRKWPPCSGSFKIPVSLSFGSLQHQEHARQEVLRWDGSPRVNGLGCLTQEQHLPP